MKSQKNTDVFTEKIKIIGLDRMIWIVVMKNGIDIKCIIVYNDTEVR